MIDSLIDPPTGHARNRELQSGILRPIAVKVFGRSVFGFEASRQLAALRQGRRSAADYTIDLRMK